MARAELLAETGGDEDPAPELRTLKTFKLLRLLLTTKPWHRWINIIYSLNWATFQGMQL